MNEQMNKIKRETIDDAGFAGVPSQVRYYKDHGTSLGIEKLAEINFQYGPIGENGVNGIGNEHLLELVIMRLRGFQSSKFNCKENACALTHCEEALMWLEKRTRDREARGVVGKNIP